MICWIMHVPLCLQAIMGGRAVELSPDDYVYAAVQVRWATAGICGEQSLPEAWTVAYWSM
jgi:hypothetical protein